tara:strand:- start:9798 stop:10325 length:528 start_codon:yes stop_codon:yes gene_type:complete
MKNVASLNLIIGPMFSGKTSELFRIAKRLQSIELKVLMLNYHEDKRYSSTHMATHDKDVLPCKFIYNFDNLKYDDYDVICINEAQFFTKLVPFCKKVLESNKSLYISGLDGDYKQEKFGEILDLIPLANSITKLHAFCKICKDGTHAHFTKRLVSNKYQKLIGSEEYLPVCREHL